MSRLPDSVTERSYVLESGEGLDDLVSDVKSFEGPPDTRVYGPVEMGIRGTTDTGPYTPRVTSFDYFGTTYWMRKSTFGLKTFYYSHAVSCPCSSISTGELREGDLLGQTQTSPFGSHDTDFCLTISPYGNTQKGAWFIPT